MDDIQIQNLESELVPSMKFRTREWRYMPDTTGTFTDGKIRYDTIQNLSDWIIWANAYIDMYLEFDSGTTFNFTDDASRIALKNGVSSCFFSSQIIVNNVNVSNNDHTNEMTNIRHLVSHSEDWERNHGIEEHYAIDDVERPIVHNATVTPVGAERAYAQQQGLLIERRATSDTNTANNLITKEDDLYQNKGFRKRVEMFKDNAQLVGNNYRLRVRVPLKRINNLFESLNMPLNNLRLNMIFGLCNSDNSTNQTMYTHVEQGAANDEPSVTAVSSRPAVSVRVVAGTRPRLYFEVVQFDSDTFTRISPLLDPSNPSPFTKSLKFHDHKVFRFNANVAPGEPIAFQITPGMRNVKRCWILCKHTESVLANATGAPLYDANAVHPMVNHNGVGYFCRGALANINLQLDNKNFYPTNIEDDHQAYQLVKLAMENSGYYEESGAPLLTYKRWRTNYRYYCFDVTRNPNIVADSSKQVSIYLTATRPPLEAERYERGNSQTNNPHSYIRNDNNNNINLYAFVEYEVDLDIDLKSGAVQVNNQ